VTIIAKKKERKKRKKIHKKKEKKNENLSVVGGTQRSNAIDVGFGAFFRGLEPLGVWEA
jgi:hypothetical protein